MRRPKRRTEHLSCLASGGRCFRQENPQAPATRHLQEKQKAQTNTTIESQERGHQLIPTGACSRTVEYNKGFEDRHMFNFTTKPLLY